MVDLHMHILPGLDDGASSMEESIRMARQAAAGGVNYIAASSVIFPVSATMQTYFNCCNVIVPPAFSVYPSFLLVYLPLFLMIVIFCR